MPLTVFKHVCRSKTIYGTVISYVMPKENNKKVTVYDNFYLVYIYIVISVYFQGDLVHVRELKHVKGFEMKNKILQVIKTVSLLVDSAY